ncbi:MAG: hypothetical protein ACI4C5_08370 [Lachnospiraceae bacterium]
MFKKLVAPIIITCLIVVYYIFFFCVLMVGISSNIGKFLAGVIPLCLIGVMVYVLIQRIHEIRSGEEDDLSKY